MPFRDPENCLRDILKPIDHVQEFVAHMAHEQFRSDRKTEAAVERELQIISEAATRLGDTAETLCPGMDWPGIRGFGNFLRHEYDNLNPLLVWQVIKEELPPLKIALQSALAGLAK